MTTPIEVKTGDKCLIVLKDYNGGDAYEASVVRVTPSGQLRVGFERQGRKVELSFYRPKWGGNFREVGGNSSYRSSSWYLYFGEDAEAQRKITAEHTEQRLIYFALNAALGGMPTGWGRSVPKNTDIADLRNKLAKVIGALNEAERWNNKQALQEANNA